MTAVEERARRRSKSLGWKRIGMLGFTRLDYEDESERTKGTGGP